MLYCMYVPCFATKHHEKCIKCEKCLKNSLRIFYGNLRDKCIIPAQKYTGNGCRNKWILRQEKKYSAI